MRVYLLIAESVFDDCQESGFHYIQIPIRRRGGIGRRARLKIAFSNECRFDPDRRYFFDHTQS